ncbi:uncharacterized protein F5147DRAFT_837131 [Suillus discolor]|uniref:Uncharacterized protein n=1 Tax=Suillus discolor TaxID=1912936 RepID=A0A9P7F5F6_9AGAM|nr:uncharacterized protein F5147DRAFT_837131 [Suillus discolor]KAG2107908.1 hypothetical protein F5147DRAFT_837131 [Suillus discolor]
MQSTRIESFSSSLNESAHLVVRDIQSTTIAPSQSFAHHLPSDDELYASNLDALGFHKQVPGFQFAHPDSAQYDLEEDANNINANMHYVPQNLLYAPRPIPAHVNTDTILARDDATRIPQVRPTFVHTQTSTGSNGPALRATLPAPFTYCIPREFLEAESIIPMMIYEKLDEHHDMPLRLPPFFNVPDARQYAQLISNFCQHKDAVTRRYYSKAPRDPCFHNGLRRPRIYPIKLLNQLPNHLERYKDAFPEPLPMVIIRNSEVICMNPPRWDNMYGVIIHVLHTEHPSNSENLENPEDTLWSMALKRGVSASYKPLSGGQPSVVTSPVQFGNMIYSAEELTYFNLAVNVFMEVPTFPGSGLKEPAAAYKGAFILNVIDYPMDPAYWTELSEDRKMDVYWGAPQLFGGLPTLCPNFPAVNLHFQNWDTNLLGVLDDLKFGTVDDSIDVASARNGN